MLITREIADQIKQKILLSQGILIIPHKNVDGDGLGAALAMRMACEQLGRRATVAISDQRLPEKLHFLSGFDEIVRDFDPRNFDLVLFVDHSEFPRTGFTERYPEWENETKRLVIIDHHETTRTAQPTADSVIFSDPESPAVSMILLRIFKFWGIKITPEIATCLLLGVYTDTNSFKTESTNEEVMRIAAELMDLGGDMQKISQDFFRKRETGVLKLWGIAMSRLRVAKSGAAVTAVYQKDFEATGTDMGALGGLINDMVRSVKGSHFAVLLVEKDNEVKVSLRGTSFDEDFDVSKIAALYGGGGHKKAAGFSLPGHLHEEIVWKIDPEPIS